MFANVKMPWVSRLGHTCTDFSTMWFDLILEGHRLSQEVSKDPRSEWDIKSEKIWVKY
jgi:hypothetical protein